MKSSTIHQRQDICTMSRLADLLLPLQHRKF